MLIGRDPMCDIVVSSPHVSARHAEITPAGAGTYLLVDLASAGGTFVNGVRIESARIRLTDRLSFGGIDVSLAPYEHLLSARGSRSESHPAYPASAPAAYGIPAHPAFGATPDPVRPQPDPGAWVRPTAALPPAAAVPVIAPSEPWFLQQFWNADLLTPIVRAVRVLIQVAIALGAIGLLIAVAKTADRSGDAAGVMLVVGLVVLGLLYVVLMFYPDLVSLICSVERHTRRPTAPEGYRYVGLQSISLAWRYFAVMLAAAAILLPVELMLNWATESVEWLQRAAYRSMGSESRLWEFFTMATLLAIVVFAGFCAVQDFQSRRRPRLVTVSMALLAFPVIALFLSHGEGDFRLSSGAAALILLGWVVAAVLAVRRLRSATPLADVQKGTTIAVIAIAAMLLATRGGLLLAAAGSVRALLLSATGEGSTLETLAGLVPNVPSGGRSLITVLLMVPLLISAAMYWLKSDTAKTVLNIERNLRPGDVPPQRSAYVAYAGMVTYGSAAVIALLLAFSLQKSDEVAAALQRLVGPAAALFRDFGRVELLWSGMLLILGIIALYDLVRTTFDLVAYTSRPDAPPTARFWTLRVIVAVQYVAAAILGVLIVSVFWKASRDLAIRVAGLGLGALAFLTLTFAAAIILNLLQLEANVRIEGTLSAPPSHYPSLSFIATGGKVIAWLLTIMAAIGIYAIGKSSIGLPELLMALTLLAALFVVLSSVPDFVRLLLTIERHFVQRSTLVNR